ncbi:choline O-acetyltransferase-like [Oncorhynchus nerka]|uniref:choline O-acetyltransferase-like n=1 Tax=Oncorhynchus nerka TaxID=8023 RepID=UPI0031B7F610
MALLDYPIPELDVTLQEAGRVLQLTLSPELYPQFKNTLSQQREVLQEAQKCLAAAASGRENWVTEQFKSRLLSCTDPLPTSTAIPAVLPPSRARKECAQLERAAALLWAVAKMYSEPSLVEGEGQTERTQQSEVFAASRIPGKTQDEIKVYQDCLHAIVICARGVFSVNILQHPSPGGPMSPLPFPDIYSQVVHVMSQHRAAKNNKPSAICGLSALQRQAWSAVREEILRAGGAAAASLGLMESAVVALSLEDCNAPADLADTLNAVRLGGGDGPCLRYYDKVVNLVVFKDSTAGMVFEHSALDGMVAGLVAETVWYLSESLTVDLVQANTGSNGSACLNKADSSSPSPLAFPLQGITKTDPKVLP